MKNFRLLSSKHRKKHSLQNSDIEFKIAFGKWATLKPIGQNQTFHCRSENMLLDTIDLHFSKLAHSLQVVLNIPIVNGVISGVEGVTHALQLFKHKGFSNNFLYITEIKSVKQFDMLIRLFAIVASFQMGHTC